jgi:hypothetical protein
MPLMAPGRYERSSTTEKTQRRQTANFLNCRRSENLFSVNEGVPGPSDYESAQCKEQTKVWSSSVQAFGLTQSRFFKPPDQYDKGEDPGPGFY